MAAPGQTGTAHARNLEFFVHDIELLDGAGQPHALKLLSGHASQNGDVALVDLAGPAGSSLQKSVRGTLESSARNFSGIRFTVGVPFALNHANPLTATPPLDRSEFFWTWQSGYKFLRADLSVDGHEYAFHLGSTGCSSASALRPPSQQCAQPHRVRVELKGDPLNEVIRFRLEPLAMAARTAGFVTCTGNYGQAPACAPPFATTGLDAETGACPTGICAEQQLWSLE